MIQGVLKRWAKHSSDIIFGKISLFGQTKSWFLGNNLWFSYINYTSPMSDVVLISIAGHLTFLKFYLLVRYQRVHRTLDIQNNVVSVCIKCALKPHGCLSFCYGRRHIADACAGTYCTVQSIEHSSLIAIWS